MAFLWLILLWPVLEIALFIKVGGAIGILPTLALIVVAGIVGVWVVRMQGFLVMNDLRLRLSDLRDPTEPMAHGALIALAGVLFMVPGFLGDLIGIALLVPAVRRWIIGRIARRGALGGMAFGTGLDRGSPGGGYRPTVIDGEFYETGDEDAPAPRTPRRPSGWTQP